MGSISSARQGSQQTSSSNSYGYNSAFNEAQNQSNQSIWGAQQPGLQSLYARGQSLLGGQDPGAAVANQGIDAWSQAMQPGSNPFFDKSVQSAIDQASQGFTRNILPELEARGVGANQYGSSRDQLARGQAAGDFGADLSRFASQQYAQQYAGDQSRQAALIGLTPEMQRTQYAPMELATRMLGGPTVLGQSSGSSTGGSVGEQFAQSESRGSSYGKDDRLSILKS